MDLKKSHKANLERKQSGRFFLGLTITLSLILIGFEWTTLSTKLAEVYAAPEIHFDLEDENGLPMSAFVPRPKKNSPHTSNAHIL